jgi:hypothetical protein
MAQLVDDDEDVKEEDDFEEGDDGKEKGLEPVVIAVGNDDDQKEKEEAEEAKIPEGRWALGVGGPFGLVVKSDVVVAVGGNVVGHDTKNRWDVRDVRLGQGNSLIITQIKHRL